MKKTGKIFIISAPSGAGKTTLVERLLKKKQLNLHRSISVTTRTKRGREQEGRDYFFIPEEKFKRLRSEKKLLEWAKVFSHYYGTPRDFVGRCLKKGHHLILAIDVRGARQVKRRFPEAVSIFVLPPSLSDLKRRLLKRSTDSREEIKRRLKRAEAEITQAPTYDYVVVNKEVSRALRELETIVKVEISFCG